ncbi:MAG: hypothetical protein ACC628_05455 [Pirellulaceae bacterium]
MFAIAILPLTVFAQNEAGDDLLDAAKAPANGAAEIQSIKDQLRLLSENLTKTVETVGEHETQIGQLKSDMMALTGQINEEIQKQQQILDAISQPDSSGNYVPRLSAAMRSDDFRKEMQAAVNESLREQGDFRIHNKTGQYQRILVNRQEYGVSAGERLTLKVPVGTVTTQIPGRDLTNWTVSAPKYDQSIEIVPSSEPIRTTVARPVYVPTTSYIPTTSYYAPAPTTTYYVPTTTYYTPVAPVTTYYAPYYRRRGLLGLGLLRDWSTPAVTPY